MINTQTGKQGFLWFFGRVVDVDDPLLLGRTKVLIFDQHDSNSDPEDFRWAIPILPVTSPSAVSGSTAAGSTMNLIVGSMVFGFFADGAERQQPMILGSFHTAPNYPSLAGISIPEQAYTKKAKPRITGNDPTDTADPQYPLNNVYTSPAGHVVEIDNTPGSQRVAVHHNSGSYVEIDNNGDVVIGSTRAANYSSAAETNITAGGSVNLLSQGGSARLSAQQTVSIESAANIRLVSTSNITLEAPAGVMIDGPLIVTGPVSIPNTVSGPFTTFSGEVVHVSNGLIVGLG